MRPRKLRQVPLKPLAADTVSGVINAVVAEKAKTIATIAMILFRNFFIFNSYFFNHNTKLRKNQDFTGYAYTIFLTIWEILGDYA